MTDNIETIRVTVTGMGQQDDSGVVDVVSVQQHLQVASCAYQLEAEVERLKAENETLQTVCDGWVAAYEQRGELLRTSEDHIKTLIRENAKLHKLIDGGE
jgi:hypothetical protein